MFNTDLILEIQNVNTTALLAAVAIVIFVVILLLHNKMTPRIMSSPGGKQFLQLHNLQVHDSLPNRGHREIHGMSREKK